MTWQASYSTPATGDAAMRALLDAALAAGWTVPSSSDGLTYNSTGNQITTDSGAGSFANTGAWARLRQPGGGREILVQRGTTSVLWRVLYSVAGFTDGTLAGITQVPTGTDQQFLIGGGSDVSPTYATLLGADGGFRWLLAFDDATPYACWAAGLTIGTLACTSAIVLLSMEAGSFDVADADPYAAIATSTSPLVVAQLWQAHNAYFANFHSWYRYGLVGAAWAGCSFGAPAFGQGFIGGEGPLPNLGLASSVSNQEVPLDIMSGFRHTVAGYKGLVSNAKYVSGTSATVPNGTHLTDANSAYWVRAGDLWLQWTATVPSL